jgi:hypothetical protein
MKIDKKLYKTKTEAHVKRLEAREMWKTFRKHEDDPNSPLSKSLPHLLHACQNTCPCDEELIRREDHDTGRIEVWECPSCHCHHYLRKHG